MENEKKKIREEKDEDEKEEQWQEQQQRRECDSKQKEQRKPEEIIDPAELREAKILNPAFDVTPAELITALITEKGIMRPELLETERAPVVDIDGVDQSISVRVEGAEIEALSVHLLQDGRKYVVPIPETGIQFGTGRRRFVEPAGKMVVIGKVV